MGAFVCLRIPITRISNFICVVRGLKLLKVYENRRKGRFKWKLLCIGIFEFY